jgi:hypothetical protein
MLLKEHLMAELMKQKNQQILNQEELELTNMLTGQPIHLYYLGLFFPIFIQKISKQLEKQRYC